MVTQSCFCGSAFPFTQCCEPILVGNQKAVTAEVLMRSRYSAYATHNADYLIATTHSSTRTTHSKNEILYWATSNQWQRLEIIRVTSNTVEFKAFYFNPNKELQVHHEHSRFVEENGEWMYVDGDYFEL
ncbi:preprotein translocase SecA [Flavobacterium ammoniigenes]|jgi:SEC-C motif-containing protein|uniref:Preprotein translocase SecA n=1 Tax=Flavobacterium ammoniigenes TaxID=1751095 RepID=A0ABM7V7D3_9FLAO|nr:YchJ family metal-binding protein [Flavobacterium ammoniigenes]BDB55466.1 preprotein translocase SecA [Flavobacterium ammoniigenes]